MAYLSRDEFGLRARAASPLIPVDVEGVGRVAVLQMTQADLERYMVLREEDLTDVDALRQARDVVARYVVDGERRPLFESADDDMLMGLPALQVIDLAAAVLNAATGRGETEAGDEADAGKASTSSGGSA